MGRHTWAPFCCWRLLLRRREADELAAPHVLPAIEDHTLFVPRCASQQN
jgi:hypothetical protein